MNGEPNNPDDHEDEAGEPLAILADFQQEPSPQFLGRIRRKIDRRVTVSNVVSIGWHLPKLVVVEFLNMLFHVFGATNLQKGDKP